MERDGDFVNLDPSEEREAGVRSPVELSYAKRDWLMGAIRLEGIEMDALASRDEPSEDDKSRLRMHVARIRARVLLSEFISRELMMDTQVEEFAGNIPDCPPI